MLDLFKNPPSEYHISPFWLWNGRLDPSEIDRQIREMHLKGIGGFFIEGRLAHRTGDNSDDLLKCIERACEIAERLGMHVYQYDKTQSESGKSISQIKSRSSKMHAQGHKRTLSKVFGESKWSLSLEGMKSVIDQQATLGVNFVCPVAFHYSLDAVTGRSIPPSQFYQAPYWRYYKNLADYTARLSYVMSLGKHRAQVALLRSDGDPDPLAEEFLEAYCENLLREHVDYDILDESAIRQATVVDGHLTLAGENYEFLIMTPMKSIDPGAASKIKEFLLDGGRVMGTTILPTEDSIGSRHDEVRSLFESMFDIDPSEAKDRVERGNLPHEPELISHDSSALFMQAASPAGAMKLLHKAVRAAIKPTVSVRHNGCECGDITCIHRSADGMEIFFFSNNTSEPREAQISIRCDGAPHMLNLETGSITALPNCTQQGSRTVLLHRFERYGSLLVAFNNEPALAVVPPAIEDGQEVGLSEEWEFDIEQPNCLSLPVWSFNTLIQHNKELYEYTTTFDIATKPDGLLLVLQDTPEFGIDGEIAVYVNDIKAEAPRSWVTDISFKAVDISGLVSEGKNIVRMTAERFGWSGDPQPEPARARLMGSFCLAEDRSTLIERRDILTSGSWTDQGYPFYSGSAIYRQVIHIPEFARGQRIIIRAEEPADMVEFIVNEASAAVRPWAPFEVDITPLVKPGPNTIELKITNSIVNMLFNEPKPSGLIGGASVFIS